MTISRATMKQQLKGNRMKKKMKKKPVTKAFMGLLTSKPSLKFMRDKGIISGGALGLGPLAAKALKKKKRGAASPAARAPQGMTATPMAAATPLKGGGGVKIQKIPPALAFDLRKEKPVTAGPREGAMTPQGIRGPYKRTPFAKMNKGGMVKRKRSIDGIAQRGKTRAK